VCARKLLTFPYGQYDPDDVKHIRKFFSEKGFVVIKSGMPPEFWAEKAEWIQRVMGMMVGWTDEQMASKMAEPGWDFHFHKLPGFLQYCLGVTGYVDGSELKYAADVVQSKNVWDVRNAVFPVALPLFNGTKPTVMAGMCPLYVQAHHTQLQTQSLQFFPVETRQTNERESPSKSGRAKAIEIINGLVAITPCHDLSVIVCPIAWEAKVCVGVGVASRSLVYR